MNLDIFQLVDFVCSSYIQLSDVRFGFEIAWDPLKLRNRVEK